MTADKNDWNKIRSHLRAAREMIPLDDAQMTAKAKKAARRAAVKAGADPERYISLHLTASIGNSKSNWSFADYLEKNEFLLAWDELAWAADRVDAMCALTGQHEWFDPLDKGLSRALFWRHMAMAAREMVR